jgi:serralysin
MTSPTQNGVPASVVKAAGHGVASALIWGYKWGAGPMGTPLALTWSAATASSTYASASRYGGQSELGSWSAFTAAESAAARRAVAAWDKVAGIEIAQVADTARKAGDIRFALTGATDGPGTMGHAYSPGSAASAGDVWMEMQNWHPDRTSAIAQGSSDSLMLLHEVGHALGLKHPFEKVSSKSATLSTAKDSYFHSVMSYSVKPGLIGWADFYPTTPMYLDIVALQALYGRDTTANAGNSVYRFADARKYWQTIYDAGGRDTIAVSGHEASTIDLRPGHFSTLGAPITFSDGSQSRAAVCIGPNTVIETAVGGSGRDTLIGNGAANTLQGRGGDDTLHGGLGQDRLSGGAGRDAFMFDTKPAARNVDHVTDFAPNGDTIQLDARVFKVLSAGELPADAFRIGPRAADADDRIVYDRAKGSLFYDPDGTGAAPQVEFARIGKGLALAAADVLVL